MLFRSWQHIAFVKTVNTINFYVDGQLVYTATNSTTIPTTVTSTVYPVSIGAKSTTGIPFVFSNPLFGSMDEFRLYKSVRSASDIQSDLRTYGNINDSNLKIYYDFNEGSGTVLDNRVAGASSSTNLFYPPSSNTATRPSWNDVKIQSQYSPTDTRTVLTFPRTYLTANGGWKVPTDVAAVDALLVGGGGGGGNNAGGGGGGGGVLWTTAKSVSSGTYIPITVGQGGHFGSTVTGTPTTGSAGFTSSIVLNSTTYSANGGGGGGAHNVANTGGAGGTVTNNGDSGSGSGGAGGTGTSTANATTAAGGAGISNTIASSVSQGYGGGGSAGAWGTGAIGSTSAGGGAGGLTLTAGNDGWNSLGDGGGGGGDGYKNGGKGGNGVVVIRYATPANISYSTPSVSAPASATIISNQSTLVGYNNPITGYDNGEIIRAQIMVNTSRLVTSDVLAATAAPGATVAFTNSALTAPSGGASTGDQFGVGSYYGNSASPEILTITGDQAAVNATLNTVRFTLGTVVGPRELRLTVSLAPQNQGDYRYVAATGHMYRVFYQPANFPNWQTAFTTSQSQWYGGARDRKSTRLNSSHMSESRMPSSA